jgi:hypothetical protein
VSKAIESYRYAKGPDHQSAIRRKVAHFGDFRAASRSLLRGPIRTLCSRQGTVGSCDARERGLGAGTEAGRGSGLGARGGAEPRRRL